MPNLLKKDTTHNSGSARRAQVRNSMLSDFSHILLLYDILSQGLLHINNS